MSEDTRGAIAILMLLTGLVLVVGSVWMMKGPLFAALIAGGILIYGTTLIGRLED